MSYSNQPPPPPPPGGYDGGQGQYGGGYAQPKNNAKAIWALVLGIVSIIPCCAIGLIPGGIAAVLGSSAGKEIQASNGSQTGAGMAKAGLICGIIGIVLFVIYWVLVIAFGRVNFYTSTS
jgi:hypothetical protein